MPRIIVLIALLSSALCAQESAFPLETVNVEGTTLPKETILELTGFHIGNPVDRQAIESGCKKLEGSGLFQDIGYHYAPGPKRGYIVTLTLADQKKLSDAAIDIPGTDEGEAWHWLVSRFPTFDHKVPDNPSAQDFLAKQIEQPAGVASTASTCRAG